MAFWRRAPRGASPCPSCDAPLEKGLDAEDEPRCPRCGQTLVAVRVAGVTSRAASAMLDAAILAVTAGTLSWGLLALVPPPPVIHAPLFGMGALLDVLAAEPRALLAWTAPFLLMSALYFLLFWGFSGQTPGQRLLHIRVVNSAGNPPGPLWAAIRVVAHGLGLIPGALGSLWMAFDLERRALHDHLAGTYVVTDP